MNNRYNRPHPSRRPIRLSAARTSAVVVTTMALGSATAQADLINWIDSSGGFFHNRFNWSGSAVPGTDDTPQFDLDATYTVRFAQNAMTDGAILTDGSVSFLSEGLFPEDDPHAYRMLGPLRLSGADLSIGDSDDLSVTMGRFDVDVDDFTAVQLGSELRVASGSHLSTDTLSIGTSYVAGSPSSGTVIIEGDDAAVLRTSTLNVTGDVIMGRAGGSGSLFVRDGAIAQIGGALRVDDSSASTNSSGFVWIRQGSMLSVGDIHLGTSGTSRFGTTLQIADVGSSVTQSSDASITLGSKSSTLAGIYLVNGGTFTSGSGPTLINPSGLISVRGNAGNISRYYARGDIEIASGGEISINDDGEMHLLAGRSLTTKNVNAIRLLGGTLHVNGATITTPRINFLGGELNFNFGTLHFTDDLTLDVATTSNLLGPTATVDRLQTLAIDGHAELQVPMALDGGTFSVGSLANAWLLDFNQGTFALTGSTFDISSAGPFGDTLVLGDGRRVEANLNADVGPGGRLVIEGGSFATPKLGNSGEIVLDDRDARLDATLVSNTGLVRGNGLIVGTTFSNLADGELRVDAGQRLRLDAALTNLGRVDVIGGELEIDGAATNGRELVTRPSPIPAAPGEIFARDAVLRFDGGLNNLVGTLGFSFGSSDVFGEITNGSSALIAISGGAQVTFYDDVLNAGELRVGSGATAVFFGDVSGSGAFTGTGTSLFEGVVSPGYSPGLMAFEGDVELGPTSMLLMELAGLTPAEKHDQLSVDGDLTLDGTLQVALIDGFAPTLGNTFDLLAFDPGQLTGTFDAVLLPELSGGLTWDTSSLYTTGTLAVVPEPAGLALLSVIGLLGVRRRRGR